METGIRYKFRMMNHGDTAEMEMTLPPPLIDAQRAEQMLMTSMKEVWATDFGKLAWLKGLHIDSIEYWNEAHKCWITVP